MKRINCQSAYIQLWNVCRAMNNGLQWLLTTAVARRASPNPEHSQIGQLYACRSGDAGVELLASADDSRRTTIGRSRLRRGVITSTRHCASNYTGVLIMVTPRAFTWPIISICLSRVADKPPGASIANHSTATIDNPSLMGDEQWQSSRFNYNSITQLLKINRY